MENNKNNNKIWWKPAFEIFSEISTWIAVPIILAVIAGKALDNHYHSTPWMLIGFVIVAFLISSYGIVKAVKQYAARIKKDDDKK